MTKNYVEIIPAALAIGAEDATYGVQFFYETMVGKTFEFNPMSDAVGQTVSKRTGRIKVLFNPILSTMVFPEDDAREKEYVMSIEKARDLYKLLTRNNTPKYWFALDMASYASA